MDLPQPLWLKSVSELSSSVLLHPFTSACIGLHLSEGTFAGAEEEAGRYFILRKYSSSFIFLAFSSASLEVSGTTSTTLLSVVVFSILHRLYGDFCQDGSVSLFIAPREGALLAREYLSPPVTRVVPTFWIMSIGFLSPSGFQIDPWSYSVPTLSPCDSAVHP